MKGLKGYLKTSIVLSACISVIAAIDVIQNVHTSGSIHYLILGLILLLNQILAYRINNKNK